MSTTTQYNPNAVINERLMANGLSKTVYALLTPEVESVKAEVFGDLNSKARREYMSDFREAWTSKQDRMHEDFFDAWHAWSQPVVDLDRTNYPFHYPTAGASEAIRQLIFDHVAKYGRSATIHVFEGEYEGYRAMAEAAGLKFKEHPRDDWKESFGPGRIDDLFMISQPSAIDGNVWADFNDFVHHMSFGGRLSGNVIADITYVGAIPEGALTARFDLNAPSIKAVVFSLSKPFGVYYDRIGGVFCREQNLAMFGNKWFKNLTSLKFGTALLKAYDVFDIPRFYAGAQERAVQKAREAFSYHFHASDVVMLAIGTPIPNDPLSDYLKRGDNLRICLTPSMAEEAGTTGYTGL